MLHPKHLRSSEHGGVGASHMSGHSAGRIHSCIPGYAAVEGL